MQPRLTILLISIMITLSCCLESKVDLNPILKNYKGYTINVILIHNIDITTPKTPIRIVNAIQFSKHEGFRTLVAQYKPIFEVCGVLNLEKSLGIAQILLYHPRYEPLNWSLLSYLLRSVDLGYAHGLASLRNLQLNIDVHIISAVPGINSLDRDCLYQNVVGEFLSIFIWTFSNHNTVHIEHIWPIVRGHSLVFNKIPKLTGHGLSSVKEAMGKVALTQRDVVVSDSTYSAVAKGMYSSFEYYASPWNKSDFFTQVVFLAVGTLSNNSIQFNPIMDVYYRWRSTVDLPGPKPIIISGSRHYAFISCMVIGQETFLYSSFTVPYDMASWVWIALSMLATEAFVYAICKWVKKLGSNSIPPIGLFSSILLEQGIQFQKKVRDTSWIPWILAVWLLMSIILTNAYKGIVTSSIFAPLPQKYLDTFDDVIQHNVTLYSGYYTERANRLVKQFLEKSESDKEEFLKYGTEWVQEDIDLSLQLTRMLQKVSIGTFSSKYDHRLEKIANLSRFQWWTLGSKHPFTKMLDCNSSAFVSLENELIGILQENLPHNLEIDMLRKGSENILSEFYGWNAHRMPLAMELIVESRFKTISESGLWNFWQEVFRCVNKRCKGYLLRRNGWVKVEVQPVAFSMDSNIAHIFVIYLFGIILATIVFVKEWVKVKSIYRSCKLCIYHIYQICKRLRYWRNVCKGLHKKVFLTKRHFFD